MRFELFIRLIAVAACAIMILCSNFIISYADETGNGELVLDLDFENMKLDDQFMSGTVVNYDNRKALKLTVGRVDTTFKFDSLVVGECAMSFDIAAKPGTLKGYMFIMSGGEPVYPIKFTEDGKIMTHSGKEIGSYNETMQNITIVYDGIKGWYDAYVDGKLKAEHFAGTSYADKVAHFALIFAATGETADVYLDNIEAYPTYIKTSKGKIYNPMARPNTNKKIVFKDKSVIQSDEPQQLMMSNASSIHMRSGVVYDGKTKIMTNTLPYYSGDEFMVPKEAIEHALKTSVSISGGSIKIGNAINMTVGGKTMNVNGKSMEISTPPEEKDGIVYLPLKAIAADALGKKLCYDDTTIHYGMVIISDDGFSLPMDKELQKLNDFCFYFRPSPEKLLEDYNNSPLKGVHPRIIATNEDFDRIREETKTNEYKKKWKENLYSYCDANLNDEPLKYELRDGRRLMYVADDFQTYMYAYALGYQLAKYDEPERAKSYFDAAWKQIEAVSAFPDWNPPHNLDPGVMARGYAIAYDWLYEIMTPEQRAIMEKGVHDHIFWIWNLASQSRNTLLGTTLWPNNRNQFMNCPAMGCCVAFMDVYPEIASKVASDILRFLEPSLECFAPLGSYSEGPSYSTIAMDYQAFQNSAMLPTFGTCYGVDRAQGFDVSPVYLANIRSDVGAYTFSDTPDIKGYSASDFWFYKYYGLPGYKEADAEFYRNATGRDAAQCILLYDVTPDDSSESAGSLDMNYDSIGIMTMRNTFDEGQVFVGITAGYHNFGHDHLDSGSFVFDALGTRWGYDLGSDDYNLYYRYDKWSVFRLRPESHNTLVVNPDADPGFSLSGSAKMLEYTSKDRGVIVKMDMTDNYDASDVKSARRGFFFTDDRRSLVVRDEVTFPSESDAYWIMITKANADIVDNNTVILTDTENIEKKVKIEFSSTSPGTIVYEDAKPFPTSPQIPEQKQNEGYHRLYYKITGNGIQSITAKLTPVGFGGSDISLYDVNMDKWTIADGELNEIPELDSLTVDGVDYSVKNRYLTVTVPTEESPVPVVAAESEKYDISIKQAASIEEVTEITMTNPEDSVDSMKYYVAFTPKKRKRVFEGYTALTMNNVIASEEPQAENPKEHVLDGRLDTRWSAENIQWLVFDLESEQTFDTLFMAMYDGHTRFNEFTVDISNDGSEFTNIGKFTTSGTTENYEAYDLGLQKARYVRVNFSGNSTGTWNSPTEIALAKKN